MHLRWESGVSVPTQEQRGQVFTYRELETATDGFREANAIGNGGFGVVYRGTLADGTVAAIKMLSREGKQGEREFRMEVKLLHFPTSSNVQFRNTRFFKYFVS